MDKTTVIVLVAVLIIVAVIVYTSNKTEATVVQQAPIQQAPSNGWTALGDLAGILGGLGLFGGGGTTTTGNEGGIGDDSGIDPLSLRLINTGGYPTPYEMPIQEQAATNQFDFLVDSVNYDY